MRSAAFHIPAAVGLLAGATFTGCTVGPTYVPPATTMPSAYRELPALQAEHEPRVESDVRWWEQFGDKALSWLVERAVAANLTLTVAEARVREARAAREAAQSQLYPEVHAGASLLRFRGGETGFGSPVTLPGIEGGLYQAGFDAIWVPDVFGGIRRGVEAARAEEGAVAAARRGAVLVVAAETARAYLELRGVQRQLQVARVTLEEQRQTLTITQDKRRNGLASDLEVVRARAELESTAAELPPLEQAQRQYIHVISTLLALEPTALAGELEMAVPVPQVPRRLRVGVPSDLLRRRPDIQGAERRLAAATAQVGVAVSQLLPRVVLGGAAGLSSTSHGDFFDPRSSGYYATGPFIDWTLFDGGRRKAAVALTEAQVDAAKAAYQETVLRAFREVESALVAVDRADARCEALRQLTASAREGVTIARRDYGRGILDQLTVLDAQRQANRAEMLLAQSEVAAVVNVVTLYKALGGGWEAAEPVPATRPAATVHDKGVGQ
jgi:NodT family efflux transporter outer membrane factor (OMF) lipoprotein